MRGGERRPYRALAGAEEGASAVEFAFLAPVLILLLLGGIELANAYFLRSHMAEAARDAVRRVAVGSLDPAAVQGFVRAKLAGVTDAEVRVAVAETEGEFGTNVTVAAAVPLVDLLPFTGGGTSRVDVEREPVGGQPGGDGGQNASGSGAQKAPAPSATGTTGGTKTAGGSTGAAGGGGGDSSTGPELSASVTMLKER